MKIYVFYLIALWVIGLIATMDDLDKTERNLALSTFMNAPVEALLEGFSRTEFVEVTTFLKSLNRHPVMRSIRSKMTRFYSTKYKHDDKKKDVDNILALCRDEIDEDSKKVLTDIERERFTQIWESYLQHPEMTTILAWAKKINFKYAVTN